MKLVILCALLVSITCQQYGILQLNNTLSMYPDKIGEVKFIKSAWKFIMSFSLDLYNKEISYTKDLIGKSRSICEKLVILTNETTCYKLISTTEPIMDNVNVNDLTLKHFFVKNNRAKRSLFNGIGRIANTLFGVLDDEDKANLDSQLENLKAGEQKTLHIAQNQTTLIQSTLKIMETNAKNTVETFLNFKKEFKILSEELKNVDETANKNILSTKLVEILEEFILIITLLQNKQTQLIDIFVFVKDNKIHPYLLPTDEYERAISEVREELGPGEVFPQDPYRIAKVHMHLLKSNNILLEIEIPIIEDNQQYTMYEIIPIPKKMEGNIFVTLELNSKYFIINELKEKYKLFNEQNFLSECDSSNGIMYCKHNVPTYSVFNFKTCISDLFVYNDQTLCTTRPIVVKNDLFMLLHNRNNILFVALQPRGITLNCVNSDVQTINVNNTGIISVKGSCELRTSNFTLEIGEIQTKSSKFELLSLRSLNFDTKTKQINSEKIKNKNIKSNIQIVENLHEIRELKANSEILNHVNYELEDIQQISHHDITQYSIITVAVLMVLIILTVRYCRRNQTIEITEINLKNKEEPLEVTGNIVENIPEIDNRTFNLIK